jgi:hypothetical protein
MRVVKIILIVVLVIVVALTVAGVVFIKTFDINRYKPQIVAAAQKELGRTLDFGAIELNASLSEGVKVSIKDIVLGEAPQIGSGDFLKVQQVFLGVDILSYVLKKQVSISKVQVSSPRVTIIKTKEGLINAQTLAPSEETTASKTSPGAGSAGTKEQAALPAIFADKLEITDGEITFIDQTFEPPLQVKITRAALGVNDFSLDAPFSFYAAASAFGSEENLRLEGRAQVDAANSRVTLSQLASTVDFKKFSLEDIARLPVIPEGAPFPDTLEGKLTLTVDQLTAGPGGIGSLQADIKLEEGKVSLAQAAPGVSFAASRINADIMDFSLDKPFVWNISAAYLSEAANINVNGRAALDVNAQTATLTDVHFETDLDTLSLEELKSAVAALKDIPLPQRLAGTFGVDLEKLALSSQGVGDLRLDLSLTGGEIEMKDVAPGVSLDAKRIDLLVDDFSLDEPFAFNGQAALFHDQPNVFFDGQGAFDLEAQKISLTDTNVRTDLTSVSMDKLKASMAALKDAPLPESLRGLASVDLDALTAGPAGLSALEATTELKGGALKLKEFAQPLENIDTKVTITSSMITLPEMAVKIGTGTVKAKGEMDQYLTEQNYNAQLNLDALEIFELIDQTDYPIKAHGKVSGSFTVNGKGFDPAKMTEALKGGGTIEIKEGKLTDINILKLVLDKLTFVPNLRQTVEANLPERFKQKLQQKDTILTKVRIDMGIDQGAVRIQPLNLEADGFLFTGTGKAGLDSSFNFDGSFIIPRDLAASMAKAVPEMEYLFDEIGQIRFPLKVSGKGTDIAFAPDLKYVTTNAVKNKGREELEKVLDKVFDRKEPAGQPAPTTTGGQGAPAQPQKAPEQILIEGVLDKIFK